MNPRTATTFSIALRGAFAALSVLGLLGLAGASVQASDPGTVVVLPTKGIVDQVMAGYVSDGINAAAQDGAPAVVIELDTPGGSLDATRTIVQAVLDAPIAGHRVGRRRQAHARRARAPSSRSRAPRARWRRAPTSAQPRRSTARARTSPARKAQKVMNDAIATITAIATQRDRPVDWAVSTVRDATSYTVDEAVAAGAVDFSRQLDRRRAGQGGRPDRRCPGTPPWSRPRARRRPRPSMNPLQSFLHVLADPNIAFILFTIGFHGLLFELGHPNFVTGILGALRADPRLHRLRQPAAQHRGAAAHRPRLRVVRAGADRDQPRFARRSVVWWRSCSGASALYTQPGPPTAPDVSVSVRI